LKTKHLGIHYEGNENSWKEITNEYCS
jgi:hypothetical protein